MTEYLEVAVIEL